LHSFSPSLLSFYSFLLVLLYFLLFAKRRRKKKRDKEEGRETKRDEGKERKRGDLKYVASECASRQGNYRTSLFGNTWKVMARGSFFECGVNSTGTGYCHRKGMPSGASHNDFCATMCHADLPQLLIYLNDYVLTTASVPVACQACCIADDAHSSWWR